MNTNKKKVGIITMHKVINFGSALQAFALQKKIEDFGCIAEIIDYKYPNKLHKEKINFFSYLIKNAVHFLNCAVVGFPNIRQYHRYKEIWEKFFHLSSKRYLSAKELKDDCPKYDIYMTGSDQVWNSRFTKSDSSFLLAFAPFEKKKCAYASSFAFNDIPEQYKSLYYENLPRYDKISVRENSGVQLVKEITGKNSFVVCDPTLLLTKDEWQIFSKGAKKYIKEPYILTYILAYSFNPFPDVDYIINEIQKRTGLKVIYLDAGRRDYFKPNSMVVKDAGPKEFVDLFLNAEFIITTSFHGTIFSINFEKQFFSVVQNDNPDTRIKSLLEITGLQNRGIMASEKNINTEKINYSLVTDKIKEFRNFSLNFLSSCIE